MAFLITGFPRSGTGYTAKIMAELGIDAPHEAPGADGCVSWLHIADGHVSWRGEVEPYVADVVLHQVRHPLDVIASSETLRDESFDFMFRHIEHPGGERGLRWYMWTWLKWNELIEKKKPVLTYQVEKMPRVWPEIAKAIGIEGAKLPASISKKTNARPHGELTWKDLEAEDKELSEQIKAKAKEYGYKASARSKNKSKAKKSKTKNKAAPGPTATLSVCMIVKNEEKHLPRCLESIKGEWDQLVIVDTGSTDKTMDIARAYGAEVYEHPWNDSFSEARNHSLSYAKHDWIMWIDADEELIMPQDTTLKGLLSRANDYDLISVPMKDVRILEESGHEKIALEWNSQKILRRGKWHFEGIVHNRVCMNPKEQPKRESILFRDVVIKHYGYDLDEAGKKRKFDRSMGLLLKSIKDGPGDYSAYFYMAELAGDRQDIDACIKYGEKHLAGAEKINKVRHSTYFMLYQAYMRKKDHKKAIDTINRGFEKVGDQDLDLSYALFEFGWLTGAPHWMIEGGRRFLNLFDAYSKRPELKQGRFCFTHTFERLLVVYGKCAAQMIGEGSNLLGKFKKVIPYVEKSFGEEIDKQLQADLRNIGANWTHTETEAA